MSDILKMEYDSLRRKDIVEFFYLLQKYEERIEFMKKYGNTNKQF